MSGLSLSKRKLMLLSIFSGLMLATAWYGWGHGLVLAIAFIPLLLVEEYLDRNRTEYGSGSFFKYAFISFLVWNAGSTWWIVNATAVGMIIAILISAFRSALAMWLFHLVKRRMGKLPGCLFLILVWIVREYYDLNIEVSWPWLTLGNGFAYDTKLVQWYEYTGALGGSLWVLLMNLSFLRALTAFIEGAGRGKRLTWLATALLILVLPVALSLFMFHTYREKPDPREVVVIQPNIDPYEKFVSIPSLEQTLIQISEASTVADTAVDYFIAPETSINNNIWLEEIEDVPDIRMIREFLSSWPGANYIVGIQCFRRYLPGEQTSSTAREIPGTGMMYDGYNASVQLDSTSRVPHYFKSKLVTGVEKMPYAKYLKFLEKLTLRLGGTMRSWGTQDFRGVFFDAEDSTGVATAICYESVFGEFVTGYVTNGANLLFIITNDGWWGDTPGYRQHNAYACLRAIETRRSVARSANTGISSLIDQRGEILDQLGWWQRGSLKGILNANDRLTFYVRHGDYIGRAACCLASLMAVWYIVLSLSSLMKKRKSGRRR